MFAKLLKNEWKSSAGLLGILSAAVLGAGVLGAVLLRLMGIAEGKITGNHDGAVMTEVALGGVLVFLAFAVVLYVYAVGILLLVRFYRNKFTDEGYLTFTLPVTSHEIFLSSLANYLVWTATAVCVAAVAVLIAGVFGTGREKFVNSGIFDGLKQMFFGFSSLYGGDGSEAGRVIAVNILQMLVSAVYTPVLIMTCITMGATLARRHKILMTFGMYYAMNVGITIVTGIASMAVELIHYAQDSAGDYAYSSFAQTTFLIQGVIQIAVIVGGYFLSTYLMRRKLNLP